MPCIVCIMLYLVNIPTIYYRAAQLQLYITYFIQSGGMDMLEKEVKALVGKNKWRQYAFQISDSTLQYFSRIDRVYHKF